MSLRAHPAAPGGAEVSVPVTVEQRIYQGVSTVWTVRTDDGNRLTVYEQNAAPFDETAGGVGDHRHAWWDARHAVPLRNEGPSQNEGQLRNAASESSPVAAQAPATAREPEEVGRG